MPADPQGEAQAVQSNSSSFNWLSAFLAAGWLVTILAWLWSRRKPARNTDVAQPARFRPSDLDKRMALACAQKDAIKVRDLLLQWAEQCWPEDPPRQLTALADKAGQDDFSQYIDELQRHLYSDQSSDWDSQGLLRAYRQMKSQIGGSAQVEEISQELEPMYRIS